MTVTLFPPTPTPPDGPTLAEQRLAFGAQLRCLREEHHLTIAALAQTTRISVAFIQALEAGDMEKLPGQVFVKGFVRSIAKALGCPDDELLVAFDTVFHPIPPSSVLKVEIKNKPVRLRSDRLAKILHNSQSLLRRGVLIQVAMPALVVLIAIYWFATSAVLRRMAGHLRDHAGALVVVQGKELQLKEVALEPAASGIASGGASAVSDGASASSASSLSENTAISSDVGVAASVAPSREASPLGQVPGSAGSTDGLSVDEAPGEALSADAAASQVKVAPPPTATIQVPSNGTEQVLELVVSSVVKIRLDVDKGKSIVKELVPDTYRFTFTQKADMMIYDAAAVKISFNGKQLGILGAKGRIRRLSFQAQSPSPKKM
jgi:cytoskeletal protein RodZ